MKIEKTLWGASKEGKEIYLYTITNSKGSYVKLCNVGAAMVAVAVPDKDGKIKDVIIGYDDPLSYFGDGPCSGKCPGRYANRIAKGHFTLDGKEYTLPINNACNHLHGGPEGFQNQVWDSRIEGDAVEFMYFSEDGEQGYPGNLKVVAHYEWDEDNSLRLTFTAQTDAPTVVNLTNHVYFNLDGEGSGSIREHILQLNASEYLPTDNTLIPIGGSEPVAGTPMDFTVPTVLGKNLEADFTALNYGKGYDNCYVIDGWQIGQLTRCATLYSPKSGRVLEILTTQPGVQVYTGNYLEGCPAGKNGHIYHDYDAVAIECQHYPDSPNHPDYPTTTLRPGETLQEAIIWSFSVK